MASPEQGGSEQPPVEPQEQSQRPVSSNPEAGEMSATDGLRPMLATPQTPLAESVRVDNVEKAHTMAIAEDPFRTKAVENRALYRQSPELTAELTTKGTAHDKVLDQLDNPGQRLKRRERQELKAREESLRDEMAAAQRAEAEKHDAGDRQLEDQFAEDFPDEEGQLLHEAISRDPDARARFYDAQASRIGEWAGKLHDKPLSEEFTAAHPDIEITPESLVRFEDDAQRLGRAIGSQEAQIQAQPKIGNEIRSMVERGNDHRRYYNAGAGAIESVEELLSEADPAKEEQWKGIIDKLQDAASEADTFYGDLVNELRVKPLKNQLALIRNLLHAVEQETGTTPESEASDSSSS